MSFLRVVLDELRKVKSQLQSKGQDVDSIQAVRAELNQVKRANWGLHDHFKAESDRIRKEIASAESAAQANFKRLATEHLAQEQASASKIQELEHKHGLTEAENRELRERLRKKTFRADDLMTFLNQGRNEVRNNWPRLKRLLKQGLPVKPPAKCQWRPSRMRSEVIEVLGDDDEEEDSHSSDESYSERKKGKKSTKRKRRHKSKSKHTSSKASKAGHPESGSGTESDDGGRSESPAQKRTRSSSLVQSESDKSVQGTPKGSKPKSSPRIGPAPHQTALAAKA
ncbi:hypothetical protein PHYSODRAFT_297374 [Phytophthora sojae]|uniref:Uncharacterized protein n=1 Tax=Phytophthora sojae (strain P6497) TaxID=1094619 RepID=G4Z1I3_PHYSP|nr:hypothetical protein PHYSODRAFT_297374 [Phytophthora sojae]EGZ25894.1 hypothetical protein PHYSODRAFT_297374 [Phytophthora sojae]|eukprot:XP_009521182.1 hypothetical protein PHYSODRAFT_297374 [Phytophthora sojae]